MPPPSIGGGFSHDLTVIVLSASAIHDAASAFRHRGGGRGPASAGNRAWQGQTSSANFGLRRSRLLARPVPSFRPAFAASIARSASVPLGRPSGIWFREGFAFFPRSLFGSGRPPPRN